MYRYLGGNPNLDNIFTKDKIYESVGSKGKLVRLITDQRNLNIWVMCDGYFEKI